MYKTRAELRDAVRRLLGRVPAVELGGEVGDPIPSQPTPTNAAINDALDDAVAELNRVAGLGNQTLVFRVPTPPAPQKGLQKITLTPYIESATTIASVHLEVEDKVIQLRPTSWLIMSEHKDLWTAEPGTPEVWWRDSPWLAIFPGTNKAGTLIVLVADYLYLGSLDTSTLNGVPDHMIPAVPTLAARRLITAEAGDAEMRARLAILDRECEQLKQDWQEWYARRSMHAHPEVEIFSYRR